MLESINNPDGERLSSSSVMARDKLIGTALVIGAIVGVIVYGLLVFYIAQLIVLEITAFVGVFAILAILGWIGYVMATTPPPIPLEPEANLTSPSTSGTSGEQTKPGSDSSEKKT